jgi:hypothetical protein
MNNIHDLNDAFAQKMAALEDGACVTAGSSVVPNGASIRGFISALIIFARYARQGYDEHYLLQGEHDIIALTSISLILNQRMESY